jgi:hypothetical protein
MRKARGSDEVTAYLHSILRMEPADLSPLCRFRLAGLERFSQLLQETGAFLPVATGKSCEDCPVWPATYLLNTHEALPPSGLHVHFKQKINIYECAIDRRRFLNKILINGECGCRGEDGNQSRLNASANLERPVQNRPFGFRTQKGT